MSYQKDIRVLLADQLNEIYTSEILFLKALPLLVKKTSGQDLLKHLEALHQEVELQQEAIRMIIINLRIVVTEEPHSELESHILELISLSEYSREPEVVDNSIAIGIVQLIGFQIAGLGTAIIYAQTLGHQKLADELQELLFEKDIMRKTTSNLTKVVY